MPPKKKLTPGVSTEGPPAPIRQGEGRSYMKRIDPILTVQLDAGVFDWLRRYVHAKAAESDHYLGTIPEYTDMVHRAKASFDAAGTEIEEAVKRVKGTDAPVRRVIRRRS